MLKKALLFACIFSFLSPALGAEPDKNPYDSPTLFGRAIWIGEGEERFPAILAEAAAPEARGLVILLHAEGEQPEWPVEIHSLRRDLSNHGWTTLALAMPKPPPGTGNLDREALAKRMDQRLSMAINYSRQWKPHELVLIGDGMAGSVVLNHALEARPPHLMAVVGISMSANKYDPQILDSAYPLSQLDLPVLDVSAEFDRLEVRKTRSRRTRAARRAGNHEYRQLILPGADIHFYNYEALLDKRVRSWLDAQYWRLKRPAPGQGDYLALPSDAENPPPENTPPTAAPPGQAAPSTPPASGPTVPSPAPGTPTSPTAPVPPTAPLAPQSAAPGATPAPGMSNPSMAAPMAPMNPAPTTPGQANTTPAPSTNTNQPSGTASPGATPGTAPNTQTPNPTGPGGLF